VIVCHIGSARKRSAVVELRVRDDNPTERVHAKELEAWRLRQTGKVVHLTKRAARGGTG
jgi:hypothetical protein